jgi:hypothetical protein
VLFLVSHWPDCHGHPPPFCLRLRFVLCYLCFALCMLLLWHDAMRQICGICTAICSCSAWAVACWTCGMWHCSDTCHHAACGSCGLARREIRASCFFARRPAQARPQFFMSSSRSPLPTIQSRSSRPSYGRGRRCFVVQLVRRSARRIDMNPQTHSDPVALPPSAPALELLCRRLRFGRCWWLLCLHRHRRLLPSLLW